MSLLGKLAVAVVGDIDKLKASYKDVKTETRDLGREVRKSGLGFSQMAKYSMVAGAAVVGAMATTTIAVTKSGAEIDILAKRTGISREALQELGYAAKQEGSSLASLATGLARLSRNMLDASQGTGEASKAFKGFGINVTDANGKLRTSEDVLFDMADRMKDMASETEMQALAIKVLGRAGADMVPFLRMGGDEIRRLMEEAQRLGYVLDDETIKAMKRFDDQMLAVRTGFAGFGRQLAGDVVPYFSSFAQGLQSTLEWVHKLPEPIRKLITTGTLLTGVIALLGGGLAMLAIKAAAVKVALIGLGTSFGPFLIGGAIIVGITALVGLFGKMRENARLANMEISKMSVTELERSKTMYEALLAKLKEDRKNLEDIQQKVPAGPYDLTRGKPSGLAQLNKEIADYEKKLDDVNKQLIKLAKANDIVADSSGTITKAVSDYTKIMADLDKKLKEIDVEYQLFGNLQKANTDKAAALKGAIVDLKVNGYDPTATSMGNLMIAYEHYNSLLAEQINLEKELQEIMQSLQTIQENNANATDILMQAQARLADMVGNGVAEWEIFAQSLVKAAYADGVLPETREQLLAMADEIREVGMAADEARNKTEDAFDIMKTLATATADAMSQSFGDLFFDGVTGQLKSLSDYASAIFNSIARAWASSMGQMASNALMGWMFPGMSFGGGMAAGGPVYPGVAYEVGERGREVFVPNQAGRIVPNSELTAGAAGGANVQVNVINQSGTPVSARQQGGATFDGQRYVVNVLLDALDRNVGGIRDIVTPTR